MSKKKAGKETKVIRIFKDTHKKLKIHLAKTEGNITGFVSETINEKLKLPNPQPEQ